MLRNYVLVALRGFRRRPGFTALNVTGLGVGIACCLLIALYVRGERSYDRFHDDAERVFRIESVWGGGSFSLPATNWPFVQAVRTEYPHLPTASLLRTNGALRYEDRIFREENLLFADPGFFEVFSFRLARGDERSALAEPHTAVLAEDVARRLFGDTDPVGQSLRVLGQLDVTVTGILAPPAGPTHVPLAILLSWSTLEAIGWTANQQWGNNSVNFYLRFLEGLAPAAFAEALPGIAQRHAGQDWNGSVLGLQALPDIHLYSDHSAELRPGGNPAHVTLFSVIAGFILLLAAINFINLSTARSLERAREVGVRKSLGATEGGLAGQFLAESIVLAVLGLTLAGGLVALALPALAGLAGRPLLTGPGALGTAAAVALGLTLLVGLLGGAYPAFALARFRPVEVLRGRFAAARGGVRLRQGLVVLQFAVAVTLLVGTLVVQAQLRYLRAADLGFDEAQVVAVRGPGAPQAQRLAFFEVLEAEASVEYAASTTETFPAELLSGSGITLPGFIPAEGEEQMHSTRSVTVSAGFFEALGVAPLAGRLFRADSAPDSAAVVLNAAATHRLMTQAPGTYETPEDLVGATVVTSGTERTVLAVVPDVHLASLHHAPEPTAFYLGPAGVTYLVRVAPGAVEPALAVLRLHWAERFPEAPLEYHFVDDAFAAAYRAEEQLGRLAMLFAGLAILVACLGLFGLAAYAAEQRRKEVGVRKVLGASVGGLVALLSVDFLKLVAVAAVIAAPVAYLGMSRWLEGFPTRVALGPEPFVVAGLLAVCVALATVAGLALRAATADPVRALRAE
jgi:putative ABC transport system permease protein